MLSLIKRLLRFRRGGSYEIDPDEIFLDSHNLPQFDIHQFEGRIERPISALTLKLAGAFFILIGAIFIGRTWILQVERGVAYAERSDNNRLDHTLIFSERGLIYDRNGLELTWNVATLTKEDFARRVYRPTSGLSHVLGYVSYPQKDKKGLYYQTEFIGKDGAEAAYNDHLSGKNGSKIVETDALGNIRSEGVVEAPTDGKSLTLGIDARIQEVLYQKIHDLVGQVGFNSGAGAIMDVRTGELIAMVSYPEYDSNVLSNAEDTAKIQSYLTDKKQLFLNKVVSGLFTPGSTMKPYIAAGALSEKIVDPQKQFLSTGSIEVPNPYNPKQKSVFTDWKAHGWVDMRRALAVSSNVYFYKVGGGYPGQKGLGITNIEKYYRMFGFGTTTGIELPGEKSGTVPNPAWKAINFDGDDWRLGDTYFTAIGQYGVQVTPLQEVRAVAAIANGGYLVTPHLLKDDPTFMNVTFPRVAVSDENLQIIREGMRLGALEGTGQGLNIPATKVASKTGTAELGVTKAYVNAWTIGFWPYEEPKYAFVVMMEHGPRQNTIGAVYVMRQVFDWMMIYAPEYFK